MCDVNNMWVTIFCWHDFYMYIVVINKTLREHILLFIIRYTYNDNGYLLSSKLQ